ncbi:MAG: hypothetical protein OXJ52_03145, partial [Oligoflexia bacterium]|nr:hypothetical protein [Oligoflexia bacterium]
MLIVIKIIFLISPLLCYGADTPSFSFSKEEGLRQISSSLEEEISENKDKEDSETSSLEIIEIAPITEPEPEHPDSQTEQLEEAPAQSISEDFAPQEPEHIEGASFLDTLIEDSSWFFQNKHNAHKIGITPLYSHDTTQGHRFGLSLFSYSPKEKGYYLNSSFSKYLFHPFFRFSLSFIGNREGVFRSKGGLVYNNHYENYYGDIKNPQAMLAKLSDPTQIYSTRFIINYDLAYQEKEQGFYFGLGGKAFFRKERKDLQDNKQYFPNEAFLFLRAFAGFDTRDNLRDPKKGAFHQVSFGCKANLSYSDSYCQGDGDFRFYFPLFKEADFTPFKDSILALRAFFGSSFLSVSPYATKYSLGRYSFFQGLNTLRGFKRNRFIGDKIYLAQTELRWPIWDKYLQGVVFLELGEVAELNHVFTDFVLDYGGGLRFG